MAETLYFSFREVAERHSRRPALMHLAGRDYSGITYGQLDRTVDEVAAGLASRGVRAGDHIGIYSYNRPEWVVADLAIIKLGAVVTPIYHTLSADSVRYIIGDAGLSRVFVEKPELLPNVTSALPGLPALKSIITMFPADAGSIDGRELLSFESLRAAGAAALARDPDLGRPVETGPDDVVTIVYTSGTTGEPKGALLTHANILSNVRAAIVRFGISERDVLVSFLPLCHMFERTCGYYTMLLAGATVAYAESLDTIRRDVQAVRPTLLIVLPRVLEKAYNTVREKVLTGSALSRRLMAATLRTASRCARRRAKGRPLGLGLGLKRRLLDLLVVNKLRKLAGGRVRLIVSGGAPLERRLARTFRNLGFNLLEGYGLTETAPVVCAAVPGEERVGTVGKPFPGVEVRIGPSDEVLVRGPNVMKGYLNKPEETAKAIDPEGWFHTGDQGRFDDRGNLIITGRLKELIVTSYGKNIAPVPIEHALAGSPYIEQAMVIGDRRPFLSALIVPARLALDDFCRKQDIDSSDLRRALEHPAVLSLFEAEVKKTLERFSHYEQVRKFRLIAESFTVENGLLTPTLKVRRSQVAGAYRGEIEDMYKER